MKRLATLVLLLGVAAAAQAVPLQKAVALAPATIRVSPGASGTPVGSVRPGQSIGIQASAHGFLQVFTGVSGWMRDRGLVRLADPAAPAVMFGAAVRLENTAESGPGETVAAQDAARLFLAVYADFPGYSRAGEALYRGAAIAWQLKLDQMPRHRTPSSFLFPSDQNLKRVVSKFKGTPWEARAAFRLLVTHFTCGDWTQKPSCLNGEINTYKDYVKKYPNGPDTPEAAYDALYRAGIAWTLYSAPGKNHDAGKAAKYADQVKTDAADMARLYPASDWAAQAALLAFNVAHGTPLSVPANTPLGGP